MAVSPPCTNASPLPLTLLAFAFCCRCAFFLLLLFVFDSFVLCLFCVSFHSKWNKHAADRVILCPFLPHLGQMDWDRLFDDCCVEFVFCCCCCSDSSCSNTSTATPVSYVPIRAAWSTCSSKTCWRLFASLPNRLLRLYSRFLLFSLLFIFVLFNLWMPSEIKRRSFSWRHPRFLSKDE